MPNILKDFSPSVVSAAIEDNGVGCCLAWSAWPGMELGEDTETVWTLTDVPFPFFNNVFRAKIAEQRINEVIQAATARADSRGVPMFWWTGPTTVPSNLGQRLLEHGFTHSFEATAMAAELESLALSSSLPENIAIEEVLDSETLRAWCSVMTTVYEFPDFAADVWYKILDHLGLGTDRTLRHFLALADGVPVATASLFLGGGVAGLSSIATLPDHRHQGIATAITGETYDVARRSGYHIGTLFSAPEAVGIYEKIGFRKLSTGNCYVWGVDEELPPM